MRDDRAAVGAGNRDSDRSGDVRVAGSGPRILANAYAGVCAVGAGIWGDCRKPVVIDSGDRGARGVVVVGGVCDGDPFASAAWDVWSGESGGLRGGGVCDRSGKGRIREHGDRSIQSVVGRRYLRSREIHVDRCTHSPSRGGVAAEKDSEPDSPGTIAHLRTTGSSRGSWNA